MRRITFLLAVLLAAGCGGSSGVEPPSLRFGKDVCAECHMILMDARFAAALIDAEGSALKFDDIGCLATYEKNNRLVPEHAWVRDYETQQWIDPKGAVYVSSQNLTTPMGYGVAAFSSRAAALKFSEKEKGQLISWEKIEEKKRRSEP